MPGISFIFAAFLIFFVSCGICGNIRHLNSRVVNGNLSEPNQFPFVVRLGLHFSDNSTNKCTGSLIAVDWVLTAAHCIINVTFVEIFFGSIIHPEQHSVVSKEIIIHKNYSEEKGLLNDIGLIRIPNVTLSDSIQLVKLPKIVGKNPPLNGGKVVLAGWGATRDEHTNVLHYTEMTVMSRKDCNRHRTKQICASGKIGAPCFGDSGAPLVLITVDGPLQIGVDSLMTYRVCTTEQQAIFTQASRFSKWIARVTGITL